MNTIFGLFGVAWKWWTMINLILYFIFIASWRIYFLHCWEFPPLCPLMLYSVPVKVVFRATRYTAGGNDTCNGRQQFKTRKQLICRISAVAACCCCLPRCLKVYLKQASSLGEPNWNMFWWISLVSGFESIRVQTEWKQVSCLQVAGAYKPVFPLLVFA